MSPRAPLLAALCLALLARSSLACSQIQSGNLENAIDKVLHVVLEPFQLYLMLDAVPKAAGLQLSGAQVAACAAGAATLVEVSYSRALDQLRVRRVLRPGVDQSAPLQLAVVLYAAPYGAPHEHMPDGAIGTMDGVSNRPHLA